MKCTPIYRHGLARGTFRSDSAQFAPGDMVWVPLSRGDVRAWGRPDPETGRPASVWVAEDPQTRRGVYAYESDVDIDCLEDERAHTHVSHSFRSGGARNPRRGEDVEQ